MPTCNINLTPKFDTFVASRIENGRYEIAGEVLRAGHRSLEREDKDYDARFAALPVAIDEGAARGISEGDVFCTPTQIQTTAVFKDQREFQD